MFYSSHVHSVNLNYPYSQYIWSFMCPSLTGSRLKTRWLTQNTGFDLLRPELRRRDEWNLTRNFHTLTWEITRSSCCTQIRSSLAWPVWARPALWATLPPLSLATNLPVQWATEHRYRAPVLPCTSTWKISGSRSGSGSEYGPLITCILQLTLSAPIQDGLVHLTPLGHRIWLSHGGTCFETTCELAVSNSSSSAPETSPQQAQHIHNARLPRGGLVTSPWSRRLRDQTSWTGNTARTPPQKPTSRSISTKL